MFGLGLTELIAFLIPVGAAIWAVNIANGKGRNPFLWAVLCFLLPLCLIILAFLKPAKPVPGKWKACTFCTTLINAKASVCPHCQRDIAEPHTNTAQS